MIRRPPRSTLFPYTTLFRSERAATEVEDEDQLVLAALVEAVGEGGRRGLVDDAEDVEAGDLARLLGDRKSTRLNSSHANISYAVFCLKKKNNMKSPHAMSFL